MNKTHKHIRQGEQGNVIFIILITIILFAALSFAVGDMLNSGIRTNTIGEEKSRLMAGEILDYTRGLRQVVQDLKISEGCTDTEISFDNTIVAGYNFATRTECKIFDSDGGGLGYQAPSNDWLDSAQSAKAEYGDLVFSGVNIVPDLGSDTLDELIVFIPYLKKTICAQINERLNLTTAGQDPPKDTANVLYTKFAGSYGSQEPINTTPAIDGKTTGCFEGGGTPSAGSYHFYQVLITR